MSTTGYVPVRVIKDNAAQTLGASTTEVVSGPIRITAEDSLHFLAIFKVSAVVGSVDITLEHSIDGSTWDPIAKTETITGTGRTEFKLMAEVATDQPSLPLRPIARFKLTTIGGESITLDDLIVARRI